VVPVLNALAIDQSYVPDPYVVSFDPYFGPKYLAKLARLVLISEELNQYATTATLRNRLAPLVAAWLDGTNLNPLLYDTTWGGVVATASLPTELAQFGSGHYNDHHFHYGYLLYAAAVVIKGNPAWLTASRRAALLAVVRDLANPSALDPRFPRFRYLDFFRGHSWAAGLGTADHPDGQDQESSTEAVNAWYGMRLLGLALNDARLDTLGRLLLALEVDAARTYWQVPAASAVYQDPFAQNRCVGRLFQTQATFDTWFGPEPIKVYGIQLLPVTPISEAVIAPAWVAAAWPEMQAAIPIAPVEYAGFVSFLTMAHATVDRDAGWAEATALTTWDNGNTNPNTLWWVGTRP